MYPDNVIDVYSGPDQMAEFFWSGRAHAYYGALGTLLICGMVLADVVKKEWLIVGVALSAGVFVDLWAHGYAH